jgi:hypothetical protein
MPKACFMRILSFAASRKGSVLGQDSDDIGDGIKQKFQAEAAIPWQAARSAGQRSTKIHLWIVNHFMSRNAKCVHEARIFLLIDTRATRCAAGASSNAVRFSIHSIWSSNCSART